MKPRAPAIALRLLAAVLAGGGCALARSSDTQLGPVTVSVGRIDARALDASLADVPAGVSERVETLYDLFWDTGCAGEHLSLTPRTDADHPDVVCRLPGRSRDSILVVAHFGGDDVDDAWANGAALPAVYRAIARQPREHTFVFAGLGEAARDGSVLSRAQILAETFEAKAVVNLRSLGTQSDLLWCLSSDERLRDAFTSVGQVLGRGPGSLRLFRPPAGSQPMLSGRPTVAIGRLAPDALPDRDAVSSGEREILAREADPLESVLRLIAVYLGYIDQTLQPRAAGSNRTGVPNRTAVPLATS